MHTKRLSVLYSKRRTGEIDAWVEALYHRCWGRVDVMRVEGAHMITPKTSNAVACAVPEASSHCLASEM
eukprot:jgi/Mesvir1/6025/Mv25253-RA.1